MHNKVAFLVGVVVVSLVCLEGGMAIVSPPNSRGDSYKPHPPPPAPNASTGSWVMFDGNELTLAKIMLENGMDTVILAGVGVMNAALDANNDCVNVSTEYQLDSLGPLINFTTQNKMRLFIGLLDIGEESPAEWSECTKQYSILQGQAVANVTKYLKTTFGTGYEALNYSWYLPQEPDLSSLGFENANCSSDGETSYFMNTLAEMKQHWDKPRDVLVSPYWISSSVENDTEVFRVGFLHSKFFTCVDGLTISAPQDGVGSFNRSLVQTHAFFDIFSLLLPSHKKLWANTEAFLPLAQICEAAPESRIMEQAAAVSSYVSKIVSFWAYNLPGAPSCDYMSDGIKTNPS